jgi:glycosyltransferase involved in cell wall biosynthesis
VDDTIVTVVIVIPVFNDWESLRKLLHSLDWFLASTELNIEVLVVDDASNTSLQSEMLPDRFQTIKKIDILELRRNLGHQRAIAIALAYAEANLQCEAVLVMDSDGEDKPEDALKLIEVYRKEGGQKVIFARRVKRSEGMVFRLLYNLYKNFYQLLTGQEIRVGNFSIIPYKILGRLVAVAEIWNHYAAGLQRAKVPYGEIPTNRGSRLAGTSKMSLVNLVAHGLSSISVYADVVGTRLLILTSIVLVIVTIAIAILIAIRLVTIGVPESPGWVAYIVGLLFTALMQAIMFSIFFIFIVLSGRNNASFLPCRDYHYFIWKLRSVWPRSGN